MPGGRPQSDHQDKGCQGRIGGQLPGEGGVGAERQKGPMSTTRPASPNLRKREALDTLPPVGLGADAWPRILTVCPELETKVQQAPLCRGGLHSPGPTPCGGIGKDPHTPFPFAPAAPGGRGSEG